MNIKLIQYQIVLLLQQFESHVSQLYQIQWKLDNTVINIPLTNDAFDQPFCAQSNFILDQNRNFEEKNTTITFRLNEDIQKEYKINLSKYLNSKLRQINDVLFINDNTQLQIFWKFQKLYEIDLGNNQEQKLNFSPSNIQKQSEVIPKVSVSSIPFIDQKNNEQTTKILKQSIELNDPIIIKLNAENKKLKAYVIDLKRQIDSLTSQKPIFIQAEFEGFLREYQMENEKLRKLLKLQVQKSQSLQEELNILNSQYIQNTLRFQQHIRQLEDRFQEILINCQNYNETINNFQQSALEDHQKLEDLDNKEFQRQIELKKLLKGKIINQISENENIQQKTEANHLSSQDVYEQQNIRQQTQEIYHLLDND
ncbi:unnamed protein product [Paramecium sonneborni]|uniref:Uncharacterized protein n=1 Tax=Paramecium sonneborni TaxID=65129 RepID=A0A8S1MXF0_9CILI|nr:unnamed protein product [Paramecium sonneborni]